MVFGPQCVFRLSCDATYSRTRLSRTQLVFSWKSDQADTTCKYSAFRVETLLYYRGNLGAQCAERLSTSTVCRMSIVSTFTYLVQIIRHGRPSICLQITRSTGINDA